MIFKLRSKLPQQERTAVWAAQLAAATPAHAEGAPGFRRSEDLQEAATVLRSHFEGIGPHVATPRLGGRRDIPHHADRAKLWADADP